MLEGLSDVIARVGQLEYALDAAVGRASSPAQAEQAPGAAGQAASPAHSAPTGSAASGATTSSQQGSPAAASGTPSFQQALDQAQAGPAAGLPPLGTSGADQMPQVAAALSSLSLPPGAGSLPAGDMALLGGLGGGSMDPFAPGGLSGQTDPASGSGLPGLLDSVASQAGVSPALAKAVAQAESGFDPNALSPAGAAGLMQLMPATFRQYSTSSGQVPSGWPTQGRVVQQFGPTGFINEPPRRWNGRDYPHFHTGVDIAAPMGTPIRATMSGTIELRSDPGGYGNLVVLTNGPWQVLFGHTSGHPANIQTGSVVRPGDVIGFVGSTGNSTGPHVHYEIRRSGEIVDPSPFLASGSGSGPNPLDPVANATAGVSYLKDLLTRFKGDTAAALAAYNAGPAAVEKYGGVPPYPETQAYVKKALQYARDFSA